MEPIFVSISSTDKEMDYKQLQTFDGLVNLLLNQGSEKVEKVCILYPSVP